MSIKKSQGSSFVRSCTCQHTYQDSRYGSGRRVHNVCKEGKSRCTVCGTLH